MKLINVINKIYGLVGNEYTVLETNENILSHNKIKIKHNICGNILEISPNKFISSGIRCKYCSGKTKKTAEELYSMFKKEVGNEYELLTPIFDYSKTPVKIKHISGEIIETNIKSFLLGFNRAKRDSSVIKKKTEIFREKIKKLVGNEYTVLGEYLGNREYISIRHNICGNVYNTTPDNFIQGKRCKLCCKNKYKKSIEEFKNEVKNIDPEYAVLSKKYLNNKTLLEFSHNGKHHFLMNANDFLNGHRCPICNGKGTSAAETEIFNFLTENGINCVKNKRYYENGKYKYEIDIFASEYNIGIEYNGLYYHSEEQGKDQNYHKNKMNYFNSLGIRIINIFEDEWVEKSEIVKSKLLHIFQQDKNERIYARNTTVKEITASEKNEFLNKYHIQGADRSKIKLGLFNKNNNELVSVITFSSLNPAKGYKKGDCGEYELSRFASSKNVIGGFSKLLKYAISNYNIMHILTYADLRWSSRENNVYIKNGFVFKKETRPDYWCCKNSKRKHRFEFRKSNLQKNFPDEFDDKITNRENIKKLGYFIVWDCGNLLYEWKK